MAAMGSSSSPSPRIRELSEKIRNQIAAGEVVERPASVVKELLENALDAGAGEIRVDLEEGGVRLVRVTDDGEGMGREDLELAFTSHATSKLRELGDLDHIASLGFRGEALASIGSVSRARILSRLSADAVGLSIENEGGRIGEVLEAGASKGTTVEVRDLFYNTPARRRFLKRTATELGRCIDVLQRLAIAHLGVGFVVNHNSGRVLDVEAGMGLRDRVRRIFGGELADALVEVHGEDGDTIVQGLVAPPRFSRTDTSRQIWSLNGRPLRDKVLIRVLKQAYRGFLVEARQPVAFLSLALDPGAVDVNVHPTKSEVRFRDSKRLFGFLVARIRESAATTDMATPADALLGGARGGPAPRWGEAPGQTRLPDPARWPRPSTDSDGAAGEGDFSVSEVPGTPFEMEEPSRPSAISGAGAPYLQIARTYIVRPTDDGFEVIDQHALHERVTFEGLKRQLRAGRVEIQRRLIPDLVEVSRADVELLRGHLEELGTIGLQLEIFGEGTIAVQGLPALLRRPDPEGLVREVVGLLRRTGRAPAAEDFLEEVLHRTACRASVMAGDELAPSEIEALLEQAAELESDQTCPHSRPTRVRFRLEDLERAFHRR
jgi:DNA mismatch repair protein MutL